CGLDPCRPPPTSHSFLHPEVPLLDDATGVVEAQDGDADEVLLAAVAQLRAGSPFDGSPVAVYERRAEFALGRFLLRDGTLDVVARDLDLAERVRLEIRAVGVETDDLAGVELAPASFPGSRPSHCCLARVHRRALYSTCGSMGPVTVATAALRVGAQTRRG